jgi:GDPmannose 4,6-dehydratase
LGSLDPKRDWGYAGDYVEAMWLMLQHDRGDDFVIATGETHSVKEFLELAFECAGIKESFEKYVKQDSRFIRPSEVDFLQGDYAKAKREIGWTPKTSFAELVRLMVRNDLIMESGKAGLAIPKSPVT